MQLKWIEPESRLLMRLVFSRNFNGFTDQAQRTVNWLVLALDVLAGLGLLSLL